MHLKLGGLVAEYLEKFQQDVLRCLNIECTGNEDRFFTWKDFQARNNNELVAILVTSSIV
jgi:methionyl-tRNA synthetase